MSTNDFVECLIIFIIFGIYCFARIIGDVAQYGRITKSIWCYLLIGCIIAPFILVAVYTGEVLGVIAIAIILVIFIILKIAI